MQGFQQKIVVMGLGYIGLPTASILATKGHSVIGVDVNVDVVNTINSGNIHIVEPDLDILVRAAVNSGKLRASLKPEDADTFIIAVPTPFRVTSTNAKEPDISYVESATRAVAPYLRPGNLIILESTSPVGTTDRIREIVIEERSDLYISFTDADQKSPIYVAHCPERVLPGHIIRELVDNDRIIGGIDKESSEKARSLYRTFCNGDILLTDCKTAEMAKLVENSYRDVNIAFANELSIICDQIGINVWELIKLANRHPRVNILQPGPGVGGHCIAVDPWFIVSSAPDSTKLIRSAREVNDSKPRWIIDKVIEQSRKFVSPTIGCLGLSFKANIDDVRESPALSITRELNSMGFCKVMACEPNLESRCNELILYDINTVLQQADIILILVDHEEFRNIDKTVYGNKTIIDTRGLLQQ